MMNPPAKVGLTEGARGPDVAALHAYLKRYGYLRRSSSTNPAEAEFDRSTAEALKRYQRFYKLRATGKLTKATVDYMRRPRCGVPDRGQDGTTEFVVGSWGPYAYRDLYYDIQSRIADLSASVVDAAIADALSKWGAVSGPGLTFTLGSGPPGREWADSMAFRAEPPEVSGEGAVAICSVFEDRSCVIKFFDEHTFQMAPTSGGYDFTIIAMHEIGHALGLDHSEVEAAIMHSAAAGLTTHDLHADDIAGIQALYPEEEPPLVAPGAPAGVTAVSLWPRPQILVMIPAVEGATHYQVAVAQAAEGPFGVWPPDTAGVYAWGWSSPVPNGLAYSESSWWSRDNVSRTRYFVVRAENAAGVSGPSAVVSATKPAGVPAWD